VVVDTRPPAEDFAGLLDRPGLEYAVRPFAESDLDGTFLVVASTDDEELNWRISRLCADRAILCNIVDQPEKCSFIVPAQFVQGDLTVAISTAGNSPALAKKIRQDLGEYFGSEYGLFLRLMSRLRPLVIELGLGTQANTAIFRSLVGSRMLDALQAGDADLGRAILREHLPEPLHPQIGDLLDGLA
jgi:precorrin-2 dehydrogenase/sirohydrochlorin ferrochelatase